MNRTYRQRREDAMAATVRTPEENERARVQGLREVAEMLGWTTVDVERLQWAMRRAHGRRKTLTETYAEAIARVYNGSENR